MDKRSIYDEIISALQEFYNEYGNGKPLDYIYGFFDALGVIRDLESANAPVQYTFFFFSQRRNVRDDVMMITGGEREMEENLKTFIKTILADPARTEELLALLEQEGFRADGPSAESEETA